MKNEYPNLWDTVKKFLEDKFTALSSYIKNNGEISF